MNKEIELAVLLINKLGNVKTVAMKAKNLKEEFQGFMPEIQPSNIQNMSHYLEELKKPFAIHFSDSFQACYTLVGFEDEYLVIGPYRTKMLRQYEVAEIIKNARLSDEWVSVFLINYKYLPQKASEEISNIIRAFLLGVTGNGEFEEKTITLDGSKETEIADHVSQYGTSQRVVTHYNAEATYMNYIRLGDTYHALEAEKQLHSDETSYLQRTREAKIVGFAVFRTTTRIAASDAGLTPPILDAITGYYRDLYEAELNQEKLIEIRRDFVKAICAAIQARREGHYSQVVQATVDFIDRHLPTPLSVSQLAKDIGMSPNRLSSKFHEETGETITAYITDKRLSSAADLLVMTTLPIQEISDRVGFSNSTYFTKVFRERYGASPTNYRKGRTDSR